MCSKTDSLPVLTLSDFSTHNLGFVMLPMEGLHHTYRFVASSHKLLYHSLLSKREGEYYCGQASGNASGQQRYLYRT
jgi:hypothetical protein